jgi:hypothetical protein
MSQENVELVRSMWEPFKGVDATEIDWDSDAIRELVEQQFAPEVELRWSTRGSRGPRVSRQGGRDPGVS